MPSNKLKNKNQKRKNQKGSGLVNRVLSTQAHKIAIPATLMLAREVVSHNKTKSTVKKVAKTSKKAIQKGQDSLKNISLRMRRMVTGGKRRNQKKNKTIRRKQKGGFVKDNSDQSFPGCDSKADRTSIPSVMDKMNQILQDNNVEPCKNT